MIHFDTTKTGTAAHRSGLTRVSARLLAELGPQATPVRWPERPRPISPDDWYVTAELFSEAERPGFTDFLEKRTCRTAAIFHDAIPLKLPHITWPQSVERHPSYMKMLAKFDRVFAVSNASKTDLEGFWRWQGLERTPPVDRLTLGADFINGPRPSPLEGAELARVRSDAGKPPRLLCVGILEPRKNQVFLLEVCDELWRGGLLFDLHLVGRVNPHFGRPTVARVKQLAKQHRGRVTWHETADDGTLAELYGEARATVFPTIAEGCGLPLLESLWMGVPCVCSDLPVLRENTAGGGCLRVPVNDVAAWRDAIRHVVTEDMFIAHLRAEAVSRRLPTWADTAQQLRAALP